MSEKNLLVKKTFGQFKNGDIIPTYLCPDAERRERLIDLEVLDWTADAVTVDLTVAELTQTGPQVDPMTVIIRREKDVTDALVLARGQLELVTAKATELEAMNIKLVAQNAQLAAAKDAATLALAGTNNALSQKTVEAESLKADAIELAACRDARKALEAEKLALEDKNAGLELQVETLTGQKSALEADLKAANDALARQTLKIHELEAKIDDDSTAAHENG